MKTTDLKQWIAESNASGLIEFAQCVDDLADGEMICPQTGYQNHHDLIFKLRTLGLVIDYFSEADCAGIPDAYPFYMLMSPEQRPIARALHEAILSRAIGAMWGSNDD